MKHTKWLINRLINQNFIRKFKKSSIKPFKNRLNTQIKYPQNIIKWLKGEPYRSRWRSRSHRDASHVPTAQPTVLTRPRRPLATTATTREKLVVVPADVHRPGHTHLITIHHRRHPPTAARHTHQTTTMVS
jgi:hypothetical protein